MLLDVRSLANASRARPFNPLNPPGVGWVPLPQTNMVAVVVRARSCAVVRGRSCAVVRAWSVMRGRSCVVVRSRSCVVVRGRAFMVGHSWSCAVGRARSCRSARFVASTAVTRTNERTTSNNPLNPSGVGWVNFFKVRVYIRTCMPNLGSFRRPCRKCCLSNL